MSYDNNLPPVGYDGYGDEGPDPTEGEESERLWIFWPGELIVPNPRFHGNVVFVEDQRGLALAERMDREGLPTE